MGNERQLVYAHFRRCAYSGRIGRPINIMKNAPPDAVTSDRARHHIIELCGVGDIISYPPDAGKDWRINMNEKKTLEAYTGEARNAVLEFKKLVAAFCGVAVEDVEIKVEVKRNENQN